MPMKQKAPPPIQGVGLNWLQQNEDYGRDDWIRTSGPLLPKQVRYQAALHPDHGLR